MKIALVTRRFPPLIGGAEKVLGYLAPALADEGHDVHVLTSRLGVEDEPREEVLPTGRGSLRVERLETSPRRFVGTWLYMRNLAARLRREPPDVAYVSMLKHDAYVTVGEGRRRGFPVVLRPEGAGATGDVAWQRWGRFGGAIGRRCREAAAVVAISKVVEDELREAWARGSKADARWRRGERTSTPAPRIVPIPNGVPVAEQAWQRRPGWREAPRAVFLGRLAPEKGLEVLVRAWSRVVREQPAARLELVGEGPERGRLEAEVERLGLAGSVALPGMAGDIAAVLRGADLFVLPSREEGMSIALLEAMALGMPLVVSSIPGNRRLVADFRHGRLFARDDEAALAAAILDQWADLDRALHMGRAARSLVQQKYSIAAMARRHLELFEELIAHARVGSRA